MNTIREADLLAEFGLTSHELDEDAAAIEDESTDDKLVSPVYYDFHLKAANEENMVSVTLRMPEKLLEKTDQAAVRYHISRSEYVRLQLARA
ncbi:hypothetical protein KIM372_02140 [Bombiscardovia nodaiensis]|uniref:CopG family transcriptional regulator n=1 Tax=Bombiscardovia nodaiensis TaxID=2932181 RepID=A0ABN6SB41_9BIFI|nr:hypothetical protein KIM372_02140 [Bombiscardovia nodaiensis]